VGLFGSGKDEEKAREAAELEATKARLESLPLDDLAAELMSFVFAPALDDGGHALTLPEVRKAYDPSGSGDFIGFDHMLGVELGWILEEGLQHLVTRGDLVQGVEPSGSYQYSTYRVTRAGRARLAG
jgi:hypothetical protein